MFVGEQFSGKTLKTCPHGLYEIFWKEGGSSLAAIGSLYDGTRWIAPINWTTGSKRKKNPTGNMKNTMNDIEYMKLLHFKQKI